MLKCEKEIVYKGIVIAKYECKWFIEFPEHEHVAHKSIKSAKNVINQEII